MAFAQALWEGTQFGMSTAEVNQLIHEAKPASGSNQLFSGAQELLRVDRHTYADKEFAVSFFFLRGRLTQVMLSTEEGEDNAANLSIFDTVSDKIRTQYGAEERRAVSNRPSGLSAEAVWIAYQTEISLNVSPVTQDTSRLNINYRPTTGLGDEKRPEPTPATVSLTAGLEGEFAPLGALVRVLNIVTLGYVGRADRRQQLFLSGLMTPDELKHKNRIDLLLTVSGLLVLTWVGRRALRRKNDEA